MANNDLLKDPNVRFTIRTVTGHKLRKLMTAERFLSVRGKYLGKDVLVDVENMNNDVIQTWDIWLTDNKEGI